VASILRRRWGYSDIEVTIGEGTVIYMPWQVYYDGAWGVSRAGAAAILKSPSSIRLRYAAWLQFTAEADKCSNNIAKYY
jgi:hypothetical protein